MRTDITFMYDENGKDYVVHGYPELEDRHGVGVGDGMVIFFGSGWRNYEFYIANTLTGQIRKLATEDGDVLVNDDEIDIESIKKECENGFGNAKCKDLRYAGLNRWDGFKNGLQTKSSRNGLAIHQKTTIIKIDKETKKVMKKRISFKLFFTVLWRGICQIFGVIARLFGYKDKSTYAKVSGESLQVV